MLTLAYPSIAQTIYTMDGFSKDYYGKIEISDTSAVFSKVWTAIYDRKTKRQIIKVSAEELALTLHDGKTLANIKSAPYGEQSLVIYEDFNFDSKKDLRSTMWLPNKHRKKYTFMEVRNPIEIHIQD